VHSLILSLLLVLAAVSCGDRGGEPSTVPRPGDGARAHRGPNVLLVTLDTLRADRLGCYGRSAAMTPVIDRLASEGTVLLAVSAPTPVTLPSHATILTGSYPPGHGVRSNGVFTLAPDRQTLAETLSAAGYRTGAFVSAFVLDHRFGLDQGFQTYDDELPERDPVARFAYMAERRADRTCDRLIAWLETGTGAGRPFFAWLHLFDPHQDYMPPEPFLEQFDHDPYDGEIAFTDFQLGRVLAALRRLEHEEQTLVVVTADHGQSLGEHGEDTHGLFIYEGVIRVPLVLHLPGTVPGGALCAEPAHLADLAPTLLELVGLPAGQMGNQVQGRSLAAAVCGDGRGAAGTSRLYLETWHPRYNYGWSELTAIISGGQKYVRAPTPELYDLESDPAELDNLLLRGGGEWHRRGDELSAELDRLMENLAADGPPAVAAGTADDEVREKLLALGYVTGGPGEGSVLSGPAPDPKDMVHLEEQLFLGATLTQMERYEEAVEVYLGVIAQSPGGHNVRFKVGYLLQLLDRHDEAEEHYLAALRYFPEAEESHYNLGVICLRQERYPEAVDYLSRAARLAPTNALFQLDYGEALFRSGLVDKAASVFRHAAELDPQLARAQFNLGLVAASKGDLVRAESAYRRTLELEPDNAEAHFRLATCLNAVGRGAEAAEHWRRCLDLQPQGLHAETCRARLQLIR